MAYSMYNNNKRGYFYDMRNMPYSYYNVHPMEVLEYQRGRPTKLPVRQLNRQFKRTVIQLGDDSQSERSALTISVQQMPTAKGKQACAVFAPASGDIAEAEEVFPTGAAVSIPDSLASQFVQQLRKLTKWKGPVSGSANPPSGGQGLIFEDQVFKAQIACLPTGDFAIKILAETRARDPHERRELSSVLVPLEPAVLSKLKAALTDLLITESPLYHTESLQVSDGSKFYLDLIKEESAHYLKVSHVTRDFRSIVIVPAGDVEALRDLLDTSLKVMKAQPQQQPQEDTAPAAGKAAGKRKRGRNNPRRRPTLAGQKRRGVTGGSGGRGGSSGSGGEGKENSEATATSPAADSDSREEEQREPQQAASTTAAAGEPCCEDNSTVESRPVENGDGSGVEKLTASE